MTRRGPSQVVGTNGSVARVAITGELNLATRHLVLRRLSTSSIVAAFT